MKIHEPEMSDAEFLAIILAKVSNAVTRTLELDKQGDAEYFDCVLEVSLIVEEYADFIAECLRLGLEDGEEEMPF